MEQTTNDKIKISPLEPGLLHRTCYLIGLDVTPADESKGESIVFVLLLLLYHFNFFFRC